MDDAVVDGRAYLGDFATLGRDARAWVDYSAAKAHESGSDEHPRDAPLTVERTGKDGIREQRWVVP